MPENPTTALVKTSQSPALARVSSQLALTDKLLAKPEEPFLIPYRKGSKWGYCDRNKNIVIDCIYDRTEPLCSGFGAVQKNSRYVLLNNKGALIAPLQFSAIGWANEGIISVQRNGIIHLLNINGDLLPLDIKLNDYYYTWEYFPRFYEGIAKIKKSAKWGYIYKDGRYVTSQEFAHAGNFSNGMACVQVGKKYGFIDSQGEICISPDFDYCHDFCEDLAAVSKNNKWGYIDTKGNLVIDFVCEKAENFSNGLAVVKYKGKYGHVNKLGNFISPLRSGRVESFNNGLAFVYYWDGNRERGFIDTNNNFVIDCFDFAIVYGFMGKLAVVSKDNQYGCINRKGDLKIPTIYHCINHYEFKDGLAYAHVGKICFDWSNGGYLDELGVEYWEE
ncbi:WG repeat-containing protein [Spirosoma fluviale]|uniref:WG containing repeat-containing protein n=1 Tax=Spirosoma fluviale TaxID=1597977 RepID=A0A286FAL9_9BACT|nr:WG repeat-containing protein [Spirosoma fluviale]SOD80287.1 WG containing repeat-containing protein [Spirosoma fluviale]